MIILAHRANLEGPEPSSENSLPATRRALELGFGIETDLRRDDEQRFYVAHDPQGWSEQNDFQNFARLFRNFSNRTIAMNVKELGYETELIRLQQSGDLGQASFYFDFELLERETPGRTQKLIQSLPGGQDAALASRLSDRDEPLEQCLAVPASIVWADEFDSLWLKHEHVAAVRAASRKFYVISPELHGFSEAERWRRWREFKEWGVDGLCTDYALSARTFFLK